MYFSEQLKLLFIACPKTGSTSIENYLKKIDSKGSAHVIKYKGMIFSSKDMHYGTVGHARAWEFKNALGNDYFKELHVFGMVRHPFDKLISSYFFIKSKSVLKVLKWKGEKNLIKRKINGIISHALPKILPLSIWVLFYPMKTSYDYYFDKEGKRIVNYLGRTDFLNQDLKLILGDIGIENELEIPHINTSKHKHRDYYFKNIFIKRYLTRKYKKDIELYNLASSIINSLKNKE